MSQLKLKYSTRQNSHHLSWSCADSKAVELCFYLVQIYVFYRAATESKNDFCLVFVSRSKTAAPQVTASSALTLVFSFFAFFSFWVASLIVLVPACSLSGAIRGAVLAAVAWLSWVQGPRGFHRALFLLSGDTCVVTGKLHYGLSGDGLLWLWGFTGRGCVWVRHCRCSQRWTCRTLKTSKGIVCVCVQKRKEEKATTLSDDSITNPLCFFLLNLCMKPKVIFLS